MSAGSLPTFRRADPVSTLTRARVFRTLLGGGHEEWALVVPRARNVRGLRGIASCAYPN
jgi:hypothetical protein